MFFSSRKTDKRRNHNKYTQYQTYRNGSYIEARILANGIKLTSAATMKDVIYMRLDVLGYKGGEMQGNVNEGRGGTYRGKI